MKTHSVAKVRPASTTQAPQRAWAAYAAAAWAFAFAAMSFYWAAGGIVGADTLGDAFTDPVVTGDPGFVAFVWITGILKALAGLLPLALVFDGLWSRVIPRRSLLLVVGGAGVLLTLYGIALLIQHGLMVAGVISTPESLGSMAVRWHFLLWDPWWLLGGILFVVAAWQQSRLPKPNECKHHD